MERGNAAGEVTVTDLIKAGGLNQFNKSVLVGKIADAFHQIPVRVRVSRNKAAKRWNSLKRKLVIEAIEQRYRDMGEFQAQESPAGPENTVGFA